MRLLACIALFLCSCGDPLQEACETHWAEYAACYGTSDENTERLAEECLKMPEVKATRSARTSSALPVRSMRTS